MPKTSQKSDLSNREYVTIVDLLGSLSFRRVIERLETVCDGHISLHSDRFVALSFAVPRKMAYEPFRTAYLVPQTCQENRIHLKKRAGKRVMNVGVPPPRPLVT